MSADIRSNGDIGFLENDRLSGARTGSLTLTIRVVVVSRPISSVGAAAAGGDSDRLEERPQNGSNCRTPLNRPGTRPMTRRRRAVTPAVS